MRTLFLISGIGMVIAGIFAYLIWQKKHKIDFSFYLLGAAAWIFGVGLKFVFAILFNEKIKVLLQETFTKPFSDILFYIYIGLLTGVFECGIVLLFVWLIKSLQKESFEEAVGFGIGFGAIEAIGLGVISLISIGLIIISPDSFPKEVLAKVELLNIWIIPAPIIERISTIFIHIFATVLIVFAYLTKKQKWFWASFVYKTFVDTIAGWFALNHLGNNLFALYSLEFEIAILGLFGFLGLKLLKQNWPEKNTKAIQED
ncbi:conserved hypothetical protein [Thermotomaculum hydrothermale]|uniref:YhfC family intramembrane metalloprotease n=1 Tax=Thermotomaculum hydrothermale TaxID=981385 RepID=A0A7R6PV83_9BACT|nr:YhfC family glutamic-type intramembrane protease [Thermotomaculum hydrothermale]BBB33327.1 conserved hypothetical protein [Thermotomaculum hydrothermale]